MRAKSMMRSPSAACRRQEQQGDEACRICRCSDTSALISPCDCTGTMRFAHEECLQEYFAVAGMVACPVCHREYNLAPKGPVCTIAFALLEWIQISAACFAFPTFALHGDWQYAGYSALLSLAFLPLPLLLFTLSLHTHMKIIQKASQFEMARDYTVFALAMGEIVFCFLRYCFTLTWQVDFARLGPSLVSLVVCEMGALLCSIGIGLVLPRRMFDAVREGLDEGGIALLTIGVGLFLWIIIRVE